MRVGRGGREDVQVVRQLLKHRAALTRLEVEYELLEHALLCHGL